MLALFRRHPAAGLCLALFALLTLLGPGCGGSNAPQTLTCFQFASSALAFSIKYPAGYKKTEVAPPQSRPFLFTVTFTDPTTGITGETATWVRVSVLKLNRSASRDDVLKAGDDVEAMMAQLTAGYRGVRVVVPPVRDSLGDYPAWRTSFTFRASDGTPMVNLSYLTLRGKRAYWVSAQTSKAFWPSRRAELSTALATFRLD